MVKISEQVSTRIHILSYIVILFTFSYVGVIAKDLKWTLLSFGCVACSLIGLVFRFVFMRNFLKNESSTPEFSAKHKSMIFIEHMLGIVPLGIVFNIAAIYSVINLGQFLPLSTPIFYSFLQSLELYLL